MAYLNDRVLDFGLSVLDAEASHLFICSAEPASYAQATGALALGSKALGAGGVFGPPAPRTGGGRRVSSVAVSDGAVTGTGTATHWAVVDAAAGRLLAAKALTAAQPVTAGNSFTLTSFDIEIPGPA